MVTSITAGGKRGTTVNRSARGDDNGEPGSLNSGMPIACEPSQLRESAAGVISLLEPTTLSRRLPNGHDGIVYRAIQVGLVPLIGG